MTRAETGLLLLLAIGGGAFLWYRYRNGSGPFSPVTTTNGDAAGGSDNGSNSGTASDDSGGDASDADGLSDGDGSDG